MTRLLLRLLVALGAITSLALGEIPSASLLTGLSVEFTQQIVGTFSQSCQDQPNGGRLCFTTGGDPRIQNGTTGGNGSNGGNRYDLQGNLYLFDVPAVINSPFTLLQMSPEGVFSKFANGTGLDQNSCTSITSTTVAFRSDDPSVLTNWSFNQGVNSLYVLTAHYITVFTGPGSCLPNGTAVFSGGISSTIDTTIALIKISGFPKRNGPPED